MSVRTISPIVPTSNEDVWLNGAFSLFHLNVAEINGVDDDASYRVSFDHFTARGVVVGPRALERTARLVINREMEPAHRNE